MWSLRTLFHCGGRLSQIRKDRAIRAAIAVAIISQVFERLYHCLQINNLCLQSGGMGESQCLNVSARAITVAPQDQECRDLFDLKAKVACTTNEANALRVRSAVISVASIRAINFRY